MVTGEGEDETRTSLLYQDPLAQAVHKLQTVDPGSTATNNNTMDLAQAGACQEVRNVICPQGEK